MANWSNPLLTSTYVNFVTEVKDRDVDLALQFDGTTSSNIPTGAIRWNSGVNRWQKWNGSVWGELTGTYALTGLSTTGNATIAGTITTGSVGTNGSISFLRTSDGATINSIAFDSASEEMRLNNAAGNGKIAFLTSTTERARIDASGRLLVGTSSFYGISGLSSPDLQLSRADQEATLAVTAWKGNNGAFSPSLQLMRSYNNTTGVYTAVPDGARLGTLRFAGSDGSAFFTGAEIVAHADGQTWTSGDCPSRLAFFTTADGASSPTERMRINSIGEITTSSKGNGLTNSFVNNVPYTGGQANGVSYCLQVDSGSRNALARIDLSTVDLSNNNASYISFGTSPGGSGTPSGDLAVERVRIDSAGVLKFNSGFGSVGNAYGCRAWASINAGATPVIRASGNVSSVTDFGVGVGAFTVSFTAAMPDANFAAVVSAGGGNVEAGDAVVGWAGDFATGYVRIGIKDSTSNANVDTEHCMVAIFR